MDRQNLIVTVIVCAGFALAVLLTWGVYEILN